MRKTTLYFIFASFLLLVSRTSFAQSTAQMGEITPVDVNFSDLARYYTTHPSPHLRKRLMNEGEKESVPKRRRADPSREAFENRAADRVTSGALLPVSPSPADSFLSSVSDNTAIPPDTHGAVDSTYCVSVINDSIVIRLRTGAFVAGMGIDDFWSTLEVPGYTGAYDQRAHYDPNYGRWILVSDCYGEETGLVADSSRLFVAVSATGNPTGTWHLYTIRVGTSSGKWLDFPCVGFNSKWIAISGNFFTAAGSFSSDVIYTMNYASAMAGAALTPNTLTPGSGSFCIAPALTYDASEQNLYAAEVHNGTSGELKLWKIPEPWAHLFYRRSLRTPQAPRTGSRNIPEKLTSRPNWALPIRYRPTTTVSTTCSRETVCCGAPTTYSCPQPAP